MATPIVSQHVRSSVPYPVQAEISNPRPHASVYEIVTSRILAELEKGQVPWRKPWRTLTPVHLISKTPYRGINVFLLAIRGHDSQHWLTFNQPRQLGANFRKVEPLAMIVFRQV